VQLAALLRPSRQRGTSRTRSITRVYATTHTPARTFTFTLPAYPSALPRRVLRRSPLPTPKPERSVRPPPLTAPPPAEVQPPFSRAATRREGHPVRYTLRAHAHEREKERERERERERTYLRARVQARADGPAGVRTRKRVRREWERVIV